MLLEQIGGNQQVKTVDEGEIDVRASSMFLREGIVIAVKAVAGGEICISHHLSPEDLAIFQNGSVSFAKRMHYQPICSENLFHFRREPANAQLFLEKSINPIER